MGKNQRQQITMTDEEITAFISQSRTATMVTNGPTGTPHAVAMWFGVIDGVIWFETKIKSQKVTNLRRDSTITCLIEDGLTYDKLRGVSIEGTADIVDDPDALWAVGISVWERYNGEYTEAVKPFVEIMLAKRVAIRLDSVRLRSWDHRKLGMGPMPVAGSTAAFLNQD